jgi:uncharacterized protein (TIGR02391 family)
MTIPSFDETHLRKLAETVADSVSHRELNDILARCQIQDAGGGPRWERIQLALAARQRQDQCGNNVASFIQAVADPVRFVGRSEQFTSLCESVNQVLAFSGLSIGPDGKLKAVQVARTLAEAEERAGRLKAELSRRKVHPDVLKFCNAECLQDNYFHAVLEATKSVAEKIRNLTGLTGDGAELVDPTFGIANPILALNRLQTDTEKSEQKGFANLLRGMFGTFRNVTGHAPRINWPINEQDALDLLSLVSYLHRRLDSAVRIPKP